MRPYKEGTPSGDGSSTTKNQDAEPRSPNGSEWWKEPWRWLAAPLALFFAIPILMLFVRITPEVLVRSLAMEPVWQAVGVSLRTTLASLATILVTGTPLAYLIGRHRFRFRRVLDTLIDLPTVLPPSVAGVALLVTFGRRGWIGGALEDIGVQIAFTQAAVILAQVFIAAPFYVRAAALGFASVDEEVVDAAQLDGANRWQVFRFIMVPMSWEALVGGMMMSWARALGEFGATILFAGNFPGRTQTMPIAIYLGFEVDMTIALSLSAILVVISAAALLLVRWLAGRGLDG